MLELKDIKKHYKIGENTQQVLKGINIKFRRNEFTSILGASGSGKTTLLNIIGGLDKYDDGDLVIEGISTKSYKDRDWDTYRNYRVGFIFQSYNLIMHQSVLANVEMALTLSGVSKGARKKKAIEALTKVGLKEHIHKKPNQLSGGQMQRVAIARALVNNPEIILADEPTGALDSETSIQIMELLKEIAKEKLVIMVTHNPEIAKQYSTRIIELKDGLILNDSNPYTDSFEGKSDKKMNKTSMSLFTSLGLSFKNLLTKKGRTFLTAFAGSIGIIGIALILALSNGVSNYVSKIERDSMSDYPIAIEKSSIDLGGIFSVATTDTEKKEGKDGQLVSDDDITPKFKETTNNVMKENNTKEFKKYIEENKEKFEKYTTSIQYKYNMDLHIYAKDENSYIKVNPNEFDIYANISNAVQSSSSSSLVSMDGPSNVFDELIDSDDYINSNYSVVAGRLPKEYNELVLVVNKNNTIPDSVLYTLGIKNRTDLKEIVENTNKNTSIKEKIYSYDDILKLSYKLILNTDYYKEENGSYKDYSNDKQYMNNVINNGVDLKVVGIIRANEDSTKADYIGYKHSLVEYTLENIAETNIYKQQINNKTTNVITNKEFDGVTSSYEDICKKLGIVDINNPDTINIYPKDFDAKQQIMTMIDEYNNKQKSAGREDLVISYTDLIKTVVSGVTNIVKMVSAVLIGFVAISLVVSSIMISIITYISVLERTKEIGILRAIGASKKDVTRVFKAETIIEGLLAGCLGIGVAMLICVPINVIVSKLAKLDNIAQVPLTSALFLILLSVILNVIAGLIPAKMAAKKDPVEALRNE
ncbi:MAG: ATP-binding cassette domain-containing protein [Clostridia bacterium]|nr:ATP-binding cassette domain-containing protein [Clostridia bacterium]